MPFSSPCGSQQNGSNDSAFLYHRSSFSPVSLFYFIHSISNYRQMFGREWMVPGKDEQGCFLSLYAFLTESSPRSNATLSFVCHPCGHNWPLSSLCFVIALARSLVHATPCYSGGLWTNIVLPGCLPVKVSLCLRHLYNKCNNSCSVPSSRFSTLLNV